MTDEFYGWTNRETWSTYVWLANDETLYRTVMGLVRRHTVDDEVDTFRLAREISALAWDVWGDENPDGDSLADVDWDEIAEAFAE